LRLVLATGNNGKIKELKEYFPNYDVIAYKDLVDNIEIIEDGKTFKENAIIKAKAINEELKKIGLKEYLVLADDSGISIEALGGEPGIKSARYSGGSDKDNNQLVIKKLNELGITNSKAFYTAAIALIYQDKLFTTHGFMHGVVINEERGDKGFGYDPLFIPNGFDKTLGELDDEVKKNISHRTKAIKCIKVILKSLGLDDATWS